jgi:hypothetical protein
LSSLSADTVRLVDPVSPSELAAGTPILVAAFADGAAFLDAFAARRGPAGELAVQTRAAPEPGTRVVIEIAWHGLPNRVFARASALRRWLGGNLILRLDADEAPKRDYLMRVAQGDARGIFQRNHRRFVVRLPLAWRPFGELRMRDGVVEDLSSGGLMIVSHEAPPPSGDRVALRMRADAAYQELVLTGEVRHAQQREDTRWAFGVHLQYRSSSQQRTLRSLLRVFAGRGLVIVDPTCK